MFHLRSIFRREGRRRREPIAYCWGCGVALVSDDAVGTTEMDSRRPDKEMHGRHLVTLTNAVLQVWGDAPWWAAVGHGREGTAWGDGGSHVTTPVSAETQDISAVTIPDQQIWYRHRLDFPCPYQQQLIRKPFVGTKGTFWTFSLKTGSVL